MSLILSLPLKDVSDTHVVWAGYDLTRNAKSGLWTTESESGILGRLQWSSMWSFTTGVFGAEEDDSDGPFDGVPQNRETEILAYRAWQLEMDGSYRHTLESMAMDYQWEGPTVSTTPPARKSKDGFWAYKSYRAVRKEYDEADVYGQVALSGVVVEGAKGYRGQVATVRALRIKRRDKIAPHPDVIRSLGERYQCEVR